MTAFKLYSRHAAGSFKDLFAGWAHGHEHWLFVSPHDDDALIGAGLWIQALAAGAVPVTVAIVTDGRMGYTDPAGRETIVAQRAREAAAAYAAVGVPDVRSLGFPDGSLGRHSGSRIEDGAAAGLECALTKLLRECRPTRVVTADPADWHPDHRATFEGVRMSLFHAGGDIWGELGPRLTITPALYTFAVYGFEADPDFLVEASDAALKGKLEALRQFSSQAAIIDQLNRGNCEYLRHVATTPLQPAGYRRLFPA